jgi:hypothetical protein
LTIFYFKIIIKKTKIDDYLKIQILAQHIYITMVFNFEPWLHIGAESPKFRTLFLVMGQSKKLIAKKNDDSLKIQIIAQH